MTMVLRAAKFACGVSMVVTALFWGWVILRIHTSDANHVGVDLGNLYALFSAQVVGALVGLWLCKRVDVVFTVTLVVGVMSVAGLYYVTSSHLLMSYEEWVKSGMPEAPRK